MSLHFVHITLFNHRCASGTVLKYHLFSHPACKCGGHRAAPTAPWIPHQERPFSPVLGVLTAYSSQLSATLELWAAETTPAGHVPSSSGCSVCEYKGLEAQPNSE